MRNACVLNPTTRNTGFGIPTHAAFAFQPLGAALYNGWGADGVMFFASAKFENNRAFETADEVGMNSGSPIFFTFFDAPTIYGYLFFSILKVRTTGGRND